MKLKQNILGGPLCGFASFICFVPKDCPQRVIDYKRIIFWNGEGYDVKTSKHNYRKNPEKRF